MGWHMKPGLNNIQLWLPLLAQHGTCLESILQLPFEKGQLLLQRPLFSLRLNQDRGLPALLRGSPLHAQGRLELLQGTSGAALQLLDGGRIADRETVRQQGGTSRFVVGSYDQPL